MIDFKTGKQLVFLVNERGWSKGDLTLWVCSSFNEALELAALNAQYRYVESHELRA